MKRRRALTATAAVVLSGCLGGNNGDSRNETSTGSTASRSAPSTTSEQETESNAETNDETTRTKRTALETHGTTATGITSREFTVENENGPAKNEASVKFTNDGSRIVVTGTITGKNGCRTAVLDSMRTTNAGLVVTIATERDAATDAVCSMALVGIEYRLVVHTENPPKSVAVAHRNTTGKRTVTTATFGG